MTTARTLSWQANLLDAPIDGSGKTDAGMPIGYLLVIVLAIAAIVYYSQNLRQTLSAMQIQAQLAETKAAHLQQAAGTTASNVAARQQALLALQSELSRAQSLQTAINNGLADSTSAWTATSVLRSLSEQHKEGLWLTRIRIDRTRHEIALEGIAPDARAVSQYLEGLGQDNSALARLAIASVKTDRQTAADDNKTPAKHIGLRFAVQSRTVQR